MITGQLWTQRNNNTNPNSQTMAYMIGKPMSFGGRIRPRKRRVCVAMSDLCAPDRGHDGGRSCDACDSNKHPEGLAEIQNAEEPREEHTDQGQGADDNAQGAGDRVDDALEKVLHR